MSAPTDIKFGNDEPEEREKKQQAITAAVETLSRYFTSVQINATSFDSATNQTYTYEGGYGSTVDRIGVCEAWSLALKQANLTIKVNQFLNGGGSR